MSTSSKALSNDKAPVNSQTPVVIDFEDTKVAFSAQSNRMLKRAYRLFQIMNYPWLVNLGAKATLWAIKWRIPFVKWMVRNTIFRQFCGGQTLLDCQPVIDRLYQHGALTILDYGVEAKASEQAFNYTMNEIVRAIEFAALNPGIPAISIKITGFGQFGLLEDLHKGQPLTKASRVTYKSIVKRLDAICKKGSERDVKILIDAEESWIQGPLDHLATMMMRRYNRGKVIVYNTFQMYRSDRLQFLIDSYNLARKGGYLLGAKLVRGAYMEKERQRALENGYASPIHPNKEAVDHAYDTAVKFCLDNLQNLAFCSATHNKNSIQLQVKLMSQKHIPHHHPHIFFASFTV